MRKPGGAEVATESLSTGQQRGTEGQTSFAAPTIADCTAAIDAMLAMPAGSGDSAQNVTVQQIRIGPGEGGKLAPLAPERRQQMRAGEKDTVSVPAGRDASADTLDFRQ